MKKKKLKFYEIVIIICCMAMERTGIVLAFIEFMEENLLPIVESIIYFIKGESENTMTI